MANRNGGGGGGGGNAIQVTFPASLRNAITDQAGTLKEIQASQKEFFQSSIAFFDNAGARGLTANQHLSGIRRALLAEDASTHSPRYRINALIVIWHTCSDSDEHRANCRRPAGAGIG